MKSAIFLQARLGSSRLPNKIIRTLGGKTLLEQVICRLKEALSVVQEINVLTCYHSYSVLKKILNNYSYIKVFAGSEKNVLDRFYKANQLFKKDIIIRATADNPFVSIKHLKSCLEKHIKHNADLTYCKGLPLGSGVEIFSSSALNQAYSLAYKPYHLEHVTPYIYENNADFKIQELYASEIYLRPDVRLTIDEKADFKVAESIFEKLYQTKNNFPISEILNLWDKESLYEINNMVQQNFSLR